MSHPPSFPDSHSGINISRTPLDALHRHFALVSRTFIHDESITLLHIGSGQTLVLTGSQHQYQTLTLALGAEKTAGLFFSHRPPTPGEMENAIMAVEDEILAVSARIARGSLLFTADPGICRIALLSGVPDQPEMLLTLDAMERTFNRLTAVIQGRPPAREGLPDDNVFAATLLILREFIHHLQFMSISAAQEDAMLPPG